VTVSLMVAAVVAFAATTIDDLIIVTALFTAGRTTGRPSPTSIIAGQYSGFGVIIVVSLAAAAGLRVIPDRWVGLLGFVPVAYGIWGLWRLWRSDENSRPTLASTITGIAAVTFANGADNIGVFTPLFRSLHPTGAVVTAIAFLALVGAWCALGRTTRHPPCRGRHLGPHQPLARTGGVHRHRWAHPDNYRSSNPPHHHDLALPALNPAQTNCQRKLTDMTIRALALLVCSPNWSVCEAGYVPRL
jgi:cadmium resistance protein CadD (predicted permease)